MFTQPSSSFEDRVDVNACAAARAFKGGFPIAVCFYSMNLFVTNFRPPPWPYTILMFGFLSV